MYYRSHASYRLKATREKNVELVVIVTGVALLQVFWFAFQVGQQRSKHGINAPAISGAPEFERAFRAHQNTVELLVIFIPAMWMFAQFVRADVAAGIGVIFIVGRQIYRGAYMADPKSRSAGFGIGAVCIVVLIVGSLIGATIRLL